MKRRNFLGNLAALPAAAKALTFDDTTKPYQAGPILFPAGKTLYVAIYDIFNREVKRVKVPRSTDMWDIQTRESKHLAGYDSVTVRNKEPITFENVRMRYPVSGFAILSEEGDKLIKGSLASQIEGDFDTFEFSEGMLEIDIEL